MKLIADVHLHSHYSRATSKNLNLEYLSKWAQYKGVHVVGTGDIAHPGWLQEMQKKLEPAEDGLFRLKEEFARPVQSEVFKSCRGTVRFMLAGEISNIYKKNDKVRKIHNVVFLPSFDAVEKFQAQLEKIGNIRSDGRPILGLDARDLLEIVLQTDPQAYLIPAHIWTPWFSLLGSMSGFDSVQECFADLTEHIFAVETGLSSDPPMNWRLSMLDRYTLVSNSDAHSPQKLAREANIFNTELSYAAIFAALKTGDSEKFQGTIEFFPEEGKYHYDGHRNCGVRWDPKTTLKHNGICPECGRKVTVGVMHRVETLADRESDENAANRSPFHSLIPLPEVLAEIYNVGVSSKRVNESFEFLLSQLGPELHILQDTPLEDLEKLGGALLAEGIRRMRRGELQIKAGFDGEYGAIKLFDDQERQDFSNQLGFFQEQVKSVQHENSSKQPLKIADRDQDPPNDGSTLERKVSKEIESERLRQTRSPASDKTKLQSDHPILNDLNAEQKAAVESRRPHIIIVAGPGTGKTRTLTHRIAYAVEGLNVSPGRVLAVTFTNRAAEEMRQRLNKLGGSETSQQMTIKTFHALGARILFEQGQRLAIPTNFAIYTERDKLNLLKTVCADKSASELVKCAEFISAVKNRLLSPDACKKLPEFTKHADVIHIYGHYQEALLDNGAVDFDDLVFYPAQLLEQFPEVRRQYQERYKWICVDEYQDINIAQYRLLRLLTTDDTHLCVIGDPDQAIYGFRGAKREFFLKFQEDFPGAEMVNLNRNYRSTQIIIEASSQIIAKSQESRSAQLWTNIVSQTKLEICQAPTDKAEAEYVVHEIEKMVGGTSYFSLDSGRVKKNDEQTQYTFADFAVLYRLNAQNKLLEEALQRSGIPFQIAGETPFHEQKIIRNILAGLWWLHNPNSNVHFEFFLKNLSGVGEAVLQRIKSFAEASGQTLWEVLAKKSDSQFREIYGNLRAFKQSAEGKTVSEIIQSVMLSFYSEELSEKEKELAAKLYLRSKAFGKNLKNFLESFVLCKEADEYDDGADKVTLMTLHAAKGLEFPVIFIIGCEESIIPFKKDGDSFDLEEERRLFYVGMTRAQQKLILTSAKSRLLFGKMSKNSPSGFLSDIAQALKEVKQMELRTKKQSKDKSQLRLF